MTTVNNERYQCKLPFVSEDEDSEEERIKKASQLELDFEHEKAHLISLCLLKGAEKT